MKPNGLLVLVVGVNQTLVWNVSQSLYRAKIKPIVLASQKFAPLRISNRCRKYIFWRDINPSLLELDTALLNQIEEVCLQEQINFVVPADYETALLLGLYQGTSIPMCPIPKATLIRQLHDKWQLTSVLAGSGLPFPKSEYADSAHVLLSTQLSYPIITKPLAKWAGVGFQVHETRKVLQNRISNKQLEAEFPLIVQEFVPGWDLGFSFFSIQGKLIAYCMFNAKIKRTRTFFHDERLLTYFTKIVKDTSYTGVGNWDLRYNPETDEYKVLEINPRFWASQLYTTNAGINFPYLMVNKECWNANQVYTAQLGHSHPTPYERVMSLLTRFTNRIYDKYACSIK